MSTIEVWTRLLERCVDLLRGGDPDVPGQELFDTVDRVIGNSDEPVAQIGFKVQAVELGGSDQAVERRDSPTAGLAVPDDGATSIPDHVARLHRGPLLSGNQPVIPQWDSTLVKIVIQERSNVTQLLS